ncbi:MAG: hypothetical protein IJB48_05795 [Clostridia bacterium]|nr:hypothetical protein [Clostridia bacterium]MBQ4143025.1 hypothetical protein [Thermoguttaceae bacterium]
MNETKKQTQEYIIPNAEKIAKAYFGALKRLAINLHIHGRDGVDGARRRLEGIAETVSDISGDYDVFRVLYDIMEKFQYKMERPDNILELLREEYEAKILDAMKKNPTE